MTADPPPAAGWRTPALLLAAAGAILALSLGIRHGFGLFLAPMSMAGGWGREVFAFAIALQNLLWGVAQPFAGAFADRFGGHRTIFAGALLYAFGLLVMANAGSPAGLALGAGLMIGLGLSGTSFTIVFAAVSRLVAPARRSAAMGIAAAVGSFGQFAMLPGTLALIDRLGWSHALVALAALALLMAPLALLFAGGGERQAAVAEKAIGLRPALAEAFRHKGFWLLSLGFFVCGFQVVFIALHLPAFLADRGQPIAVGSTALALVGLFNIAGTYTAGVLGGRIRKPLLLAAIYAARALVILVFAFLVPVTAASAYVFAAVICFLWLGTVPLTNGTVAAVFGVANMAMLTGVVFFFHQLGAFLGGWLGGLVYDQSRSYDLVWIMAIGLSVVAALLNLPIRERPVPRLAAAAAG